MVVNLQQIFVFTPDQHGNVVSGGRGKVDFIPNIARLLGVSVGGIVRIPAGYIVKHEQGGGFAFTPVSWQDHGHFLFSVHSRGLQETLVPQVICGIFIIGLIAQF